MSISAALTPGYDFNATEDVTKAKLNQLAKPTVTIQGSVAGQSLAAGSVKNEHISGTADITSTKIALAEGKVLVGNTSGLAAETILTAGQFLIGSTANTAVAYTISGDVVVDSTGAATIQAGAVETAMLANDSVTTAKIQFNGLTEDTTITGVERVPIIDSSGNPVNYATLNGIGGATAAYFSNDTAFSLDMDAIPEPGGANNLFFHPESGNSNIDTALAYHDGLTNTPLIAQFSYTKVHESSKIWVECDFAYLAEGGGTPATECVLIAYNTAADAHTTKLAGGPTYFVTTSSSDYLYHVSAKGWFTTSTETGTVYISVFIVPDAITNARTIHVNSAATPGMVFGSGTGFGNVRCRVLELL